MEVGSGVSPVAPVSDNVVFTDLSVRAMTTLRSQHGARRVMAMSATDIPLRDGSVDALVSSEVLEHIPDDEAAFREMNRVLKIGGSLIITVPVNPKYFTYDDEFVKHQRRYDARDLVESLERKGFAIVKISKVAAFLEKVTTLSIVIVFRLVRPLLHMRETRAQGDAVRMFLQCLLPVYQILNWLYSLIIALEAKVMPLAFTSILLIHARKVRA